MIGPRLVALVASVVVASVTAGCGEASRGSAPAGAQELETARPGALIVGLDVPFEVGGREGFEVDLVEEIGRRLDLEVRIEDTPSAAAVRELRRGKLDLVAPTSRVAPGRGALSDPYLRAGRSLTVVQGSDIQSFEDLTGQTVGSAKGATGAAYARKETDAARVRSYADVERAFEALRAGQVAAVVHDRAASELAERSDRDLEIVETVPTDEIHRLVVDPDSEELLRAVDDALAEIRADGAYERIYSRWFDDEPSDEILGTEP